MSHLEEKKWGQALCAVLQLCFVLPDLRRAYCVHCFFWSRICRQPLIVPHMWCACRFVPLAKPTECISKCCGGAICWQCIARLILRWPNVAEEEFCSNKSFFTAFGFDGKRVVFERLKTLCRELSRALQISLCTTCRCLARTIFFFFV